MEGLNACSDWMTGSIGKSGELRRNFPRLPWKHPCVVFAAWQQLMTSHTASPSNVSSFSQENGQKLTDNTSFCVVQGTVLQGNASVLHIRALVWLWKDSFDAHIYFYLKPFKCNSIHTQVGQCLNISVLTEQNLSRKITRCCKDTTWAEQLQQVSLQNNGLSVIKTVWKNMPQYQTFHWHTRSTLI